MRSSVERPPEAPARSSAIICARRRTRWSRITIRNWVSPSNHRRRTVMSPCGRSTYRAIPRAIAISKSMPPEPTPMDRESVIRELDPIFQDILDQPELTLSSESNASNVDGWDSLAHVNLVMAIEQQMRIRFALRELQTLKNVGEMADLIIKKRQRS